MHKQTPRLSNRLLAALQFSPQEPLLAVRVDRPVFEKADGAVHSSAY
jgi:hypothetical protein